MQVVRERSSEHIRVPSILEGQYLRFILKEPSLEPTNLRRTLILLF